MALAVKSDLVIKASSWFRRAGNATYVAEVPDIIKLAEARLSRELGDIEGEATRTGTVGSRAISISAITITEPLALFIAEPGGTSDELELQKQTPANLPALSTNGKPTMWAIDSDTNIKFERSCDQAYAFRFRYKGKIELVANGDTNWLLSNHPDVYLAATLLWGASFLEWGEHEAKWKSTLDRGIQEVRRQLGRKNSGTLRADPALMAMGGGRRSFDYRTGE